MWYGASASYALAISVITTMCCLKTYTSWLVSITFKDFLFPICHLIKLFLFPLFHIKNTWINLALLLPASSSLPGWNYASNEGISDRSMELGTKGLSDLWGRGACHRLRFLLPEIAPDRITGSWREQIPKESCCMSWQESQCWGETSGIGLNRPDS